MLILISTYHVHSTREGNVFSHICLSVVIFVSLLSCLSLPVHRMRFLLSNGRQEGNTPSSGRKDQSGRRLLPSGGNISQERGPSSGREGSMRREPLSPKPSLQTPSLRALRIRMEAVVGTPLHC